MVLQHLLSELPEVWKYEDIAAVAPVALSEHIAAILDFLERGLDMTKVRTPPAAIEFSPADSLSTGRPSASSFAAIGSSTQVCLISSTRKQPVSPGPRS
ncbi:hypothetical protein [Streptomyces dysideae]|uniref:hypothetical protein n=1 Tax=Streptomyces dysideae TaxID=909626 RepID=UPI00131BD485|nr:hypothetical protein [Streptomyces dysideae]